MDKCGIGIDIGGTEIKAASFDLVSGKMLSKETAPTQDGAFTNGIPSFVGSVNKLVTDLLSDLGQKLSVIGVSAPGLVQKNERAIGYMPGRLEGLEGLDWTTALNMDIEIQVVNDAHAALLGEVWQGSARCMNDVIMLTLGTGVGGAILTGGKLLKGSIGRAGHLGHMTVDFEGEPDICSTPGSIEDAIGNATITERSGGKFSTTHELVAAYADGDEEAKEIWLRSLRALAAALVSLVNVIDPERIVIGGGIAKAGEHLFDPLEKLVREREWQPDGKVVTIVPAELGYWAGTYGAVYNVLLRG